MPLEDFYSIKFNMNSFAFHISLIKPNFLIVSFIIQEYNEGNYEKVRVDHSQPSASRRLVLPSSANSVEISTIHLFKHVMFLKTQVLLERPKRTIHLDTNNNKP